MKTLCVSLLWLSANLIILGDGRAQELAVPGNDALHLGEKAVNPGEAAEDGILSYYNWLLAASRDQLQRRHELAREQLHNGGSDRDKLVLALLLSLPDTPFCDLQRAKALAEDYLRGGDEGRADRVFSDLLVRLLEQHATLRQEGEKQRQLHLILVEEIARLKTQIEQLQVLEREITQKEQEAHEPPPELNPNGKKEDSSGR